MNEIIEHCMYESGLTADGCWNELDDYAKESIERFAVLIVKKCAEKVDHIVSEGGKTKGDLIREHFGIE